MAGVEPAVVQNYVSDSNQPYNSLVQPAAPGQVITIWATGLGPVTFPDNVAPTAGNVAAPVTVTLGGQSASVMYSGRSPCCAGVDQVVATIPANVPLGCWVPLTVKAGGVVSNTATMAIAASGATSCSDAGNPLTTLVRTPGTQAFLHLERVDGVDNFDANPAVNSTLDKLYSRFYTRPDPPYTSIRTVSLLRREPACVHQATGDSFYGNSLRGALPASSSANPQPNQTYDNGGQGLNLTPKTADYSTTLGGAVNSTATGMNLLGRTGNTPSIQEVRIKW